MSYHLKSLTLFTLILSLICPVASAANNRLALKDTLAQATTNQNRQAQANKLLQQGITQLNAQQLDAALKSLQQALAIYQQIKDRAGEGETLKNLGSVYANKKKNSQAIELYQQSLVIAREIKNSDLEAENLLNLGTIHNSIKQPDQALGFLQQSLQIAQTTKNREVQFKVLPLLIEAYNAKGDPQKAQEYTQQLLTNFPGLSKYLLAFTLFGQLSAYNQQKNYPKAIEVGQQALEIFQKTKLEPEDVNLLLSLSDTKLKGASAELIQTVFQILVMGEILTSYDAITDYPKIIDLGQQLRKLTQKLKDDDWKFIADVSGENQPKRSPDYFKKNFQLFGVYLLSKAYDISGDYEKSVSFAQEALPISREIKNTETEANVLLTLASASNSLAVSDAEHEKSLTLAQEALKIAKQIKNIEIESEALNKIADIYDDLDEYQKSIEFASASLAIAKKSKDPSAIAKPLLTLSSTYLNLGDYQKSNQFAQEALTTARKLKQVPTIEAFSLLFLTLNQFIQGDYQKTIASAQEGLNLVPKINIPYYQQQFLMFNNLFLGIGYGGLNDNQKAIDYVQKSLQVAKDAKNAKLEAQVLAFLGGFYRRNKQYQQGIDAYNQASAIADKLNYDGNRAILYAGLARIYRELNQPTTAITYYQKAINDIEKVREKNKGLSRELQTSLLKAIQDADRTSIADIYREYANLLLSQGRSLEASQVLELLKVQELSEFTNNQKFGNVPKPIAQTPTEAKLIQKYGSLIAFGQKFDECQKTSCSEKTKLADERDALISEFNQRIQNLEKNVRDRLSKDRGNLDTQDLRSVGKKIVESQEATVLINVFVVEDKTWVLWVSKGGVVKSVEVSVGEAKIRETVNKFRRLLQNPSSDIQEVKATGKQLYDWLIKPVEPELKANKIQNLVFSLDRAARYIPISALFDGQQYLVENYNISTVLSAGLTDTESRLPSGTANTKVLGLGLSNAVSGFNALPNVPAEIDAIIRQKPSDKNGIYPGEEYLNQKFDYRALRDNLKGHNILHIATHGVFVPGRQDDSYLVLGTGEKLPIPKIDNLEDLSDVHLVVLSACETALGETAKDGIEIPGVSFYFLNRRAKAVMASLWLVDDASTSLLMQQFYGNLAKDTHQTKAQALRQAQLSLLRSNNSANTNVDRGAINVEQVPGASTKPPRNATNFTHPYYWAPFILIGNGL
ncbi:hypothetical protein NIES2100_76580 [Calothrix sp. NIES-2100]|uniref:CHAT domain-containing protein n=1 Tax=Calothrix sp. NIES-2100 TaxID=1954172 RepID=UPI000B6139C9|nr:hypothetical protein NIES2100_76580 [Calothrix sp. NIES-2100]